MGERVLADPERIGQVLRNLLSNAAKYSPKAPIELRVVGKEGRIRVEIADQGRGIHPDDVPRIFEKFGRGRDREVITKGRVWALASTSASASSGATVPS